MKAKVKVNHRDMKGNSYDIIRKNNNIITLRYINKSMINNNETGGILVDFTINEIEILNKGKEVEVYRNQNYRNGIWLGYCPVNKGYILEYRMPNGRKFKNLIKNPFDKTIYSNKIG